MMAPLPVWCEDPVERLHLVSETMGDLKGSGQAVGAEILTKITDFAPPTIASQAARLQPAQRFFNLVVTNVPGPQFPLYVLGRKMEAIFPMVPLARRQALCIGIMSYNGTINFGLIGDYDAMADLDSFALDLEGVDRGDRRHPARAAAEGSAHEPGAGPERRRVGQVVPVEVAGAEAEGARVGVDQHRGDPVESRRVGQSHRERPAVVLEGEARDDRPCSSLPILPTRATPAASPSGALTSTATALPLWALTRSIWKVVWLRVRVFGAPPIGRLPWRGMSR